MADLQALARSGSWLELLQHAEEVRPTERDDSWKSLLVSAASHSIEADRRADRNREELAVALQAFLDRYPALRESKDLASLRASVMVDGVDKCTADNSSFEPCMWFATAFPGDAVHGQAAGDVAVKHGHRVLALKLYRAAADLDARAVCQDDAALSAVAEVRSGNGDPARVADGEALHASCEKAKTHH